MKSLLIADVTFEVGSEKATTGENKRAKTAPTMFPAHRFILKDCAPYLFDLCTSGTSSTAIPITGVEPAIFHHVLHYIYGRKVPEDDLKAHANEIIDATDKYEVVNFKLEAEATLVESTSTIAIDNIMEILLYADEKNCALLKEAAMDFIVSNRDGVIKNVAFDNNVPGHLMKDLLVAVNMNTSTRVDTLRKRIHEKGLEIDGSREAMIALIEENS